MSMKQTPPTDAGSGLYRESDLIAWDIIKRRKQRLRYVHDNVYGGKDCRACQLANMSPWYGCSRHGVVPVAP